jgi:hypothetical protein
MTSYKVIDKIINLEKRYIVVDSSDDTKILDDAQGYGFKTIQKAHKCATFKIKYGGKNRKKDVKELFRNHPVLKSVGNEVEYMMFNAMKEMEDLTKKEINEMVIETVKIKSPEVYEIIMNDSSLKNEFLKFF